MRHKILTQRTFFAIQKGYAESAIDNACRTSLVANNKLNGLLGRKFWNFNGRYESVDCSTGMEWWNGILE